MATIRKTDCATIDSAVKVACISGLALTRPVSGGKFSMETYYNVFVRNWWRMEKGQRVPDPGARKTYLRKHVTYADARAICEQYRATHEPGQLSRKAEFEEV